LVASSAHSILIARPSIWIELIHFGAIALVNRVLTTAVTFIGGARRQALALVRTSIDTQVNGPVWLSQIDLRQRRCRDQHYGNDPGGEAGHLALRTAVAGIGQYRRFRSASPITYLGTAPAGKVSRILPTEMGIANNDRAQPGHRNWSRRVACRRACADTTCGRRAATDAETALSVLPCC